MFQTKQTQPWYSFSQHYHDDIVEKYNNVCHVVHELSAIIKHLEHKISEIEKNQEPEKVKVPKRCRYFNTGYCKQGSNCSFEHPEETCQEYMTSGKCLSYRSCLYRHPRECRYWEANNCYRGLSCMYLHKKVVVEQVENISNVNSNVTKKRVTIEVNGEKFTVSKMEELDNEIIDAMTVDDVLKFYENDSDDKTEETGQNADEQIIENIEINEDKEVLDAKTVEDICKLYENDSDDIIEETGRNVVDDEIIENIENENNEISKAKAMTEDTTNHKKNRKIKKLRNPVDVGLQRSTKKSRK